MKNILNLFLGILLVSFFVQCSEKTEENLNKEENNNARENELLNYNVESL
jgi:hypothetical protein